MPFGLGFLLQVLWAAERMKIRFRFILEDVHDSFVYSVGILDTT